MDIVIVIVKDYFNDGYIDNEICIAFIIYGTVIDIEESDWSVCGNFLLSAEPPRLSANFLKRYSAIISFNKGKGLRFTQVGLSNFPERGGQIPILYQ